MIEELRKNPNYQKVMDGMYTKLKDANDFIVFDAYYAELTPEAISTLLSILKFRNVAQ